MLNPYGGDPRGSRGSRGGDRSRGGGNPFDMMESHMGQMMQQMDRAFGGSDMRAMTGGGGDSMCGGSMGGGGGSSSSSYSCSSCCYSSSSSNGGQPHVVQYSSSSHGVQRPGEEFVSETHRNYSDSTGQERLGVSRRIGDRCEPITPNEPSPEPAARTHRPRRVLTRAWVSRSLARRAPQGSLRGR
jgi:hypothetical protein